MSTAENDPGTPLGGALQPAVRRIATDALALGTGARLPTNAEYLRDHQLGAGTVQRALKVLEERGALRTTSHGHRGRTVDTVDVGQAWQAGGLAPIRLILPPGGPAEIDVLEAALAEELTRLGIPHTVTHLRGGSGRLAAVLAGSHDIALTSAGVVPDGASRLTRVLAPGTYYAPGRLASVHRADATAAARRVAIDTQSPDHAALTTAEYPTDEGFAYVETPFTRVPAAVLRGEVDAGIWHLQESVIPLDLAGLRTEPLHRPATQRAWERLSAAVLTGWGGRPELAAVLAALRLDDVGAAQLAALHEQS